MNYNPDINVTVLEGLTLSKISESNNRVNFETTDGREFLMYHDQDCCESVNIHDIDGDLQELVGYPIVQVVEDIQRHSNEWPNDVEKPQWMGESFTWTTFVFRTQNKAVRIRWYGESNGWYGEEVSFKEIGKQ